MAALLLVSSASYRIVTGLEIVSTSIVLANGHKSIILINHQYRMFFQNPVLALTSTIFKMNIKPGIGIGEIKYGINEEEIISILSKPDKTDIKEYIEGSGDWSRDLWYQARNVRFTFDQDDNY